MAYIKKTSINLLYNGSKNFFKNFSSTSFNCNEKAKVGFIGLGNMGNCMVKNLKDKGHNLIVYDVNTKAADAFKGTGIAIASSPAEVAKNSDRIISMLPNSEHVKDVYAGSNGVFQEIQPGTLLVDSSTIDPLVSKEMAKAASKKGALFMDAPVSGGVPAAEAGTLTFMVGGDKNEFEAAKMLLVNMGKNIVYCGEVGSGQAAKICNNMLLAITMIGVSECYYLGIKLGLDPKLLAGIVNTSTGRCWSSDTYNPVPGIMPNVPSSRNYEGGFGTALMTKDLGLAQSAATFTRTPTPLGSLSHQIFRMMTNGGYALKDFSSVFQYLKNEKQNEE